MGVEFGLKTLNQWKNWGNLRRIKLLTPTVNKWQIRIKCITTFESIIYSPKITPYFIAISLQITYG